MLIVEDDGETRRLLVRLLQENGFRADISIPGLMMEVVHMAHPIHLHGMWMELESGHGAHNPYLHTISVLPGTSVSALVTPLATGQWPLHCHLLYHFEAGMFRALRVLPQAA